MQVFEWKSDGQNYDRKVYEMYSVDLSWSEKLLCAGIATN